MKLKYVFMCLLCALLVGLVPASIVQAEDDYTFEECCSDNGLNLTPASSETNTSYPFDMTDTYFKYLVTYNVDTGVYRLLKYYYSCFLTTDSSDLYIYYSGSGFRSCPYYVYDYSDDGWLYVYYGYPQISGSYGARVYYMQSADNFVFSDSDLYTDISRSEVSYPKSVVPTVTPTPTPVPVVVGGYPRMYEVKEDLAYAFLYANKSDVISEENTLLAISTGQGGICTGYEYDENGVAWYVCQRTYDGITYNGYMRPQDIDILWSVPSVTNPSYSYITDDNTIVYEDPFVQSEWIDKLSSGYRVDVISEDVNQATGERWCYIEYDKSGVVRQGFVLSEHVYIYDVTGIPDSGVMSGLNDLMEEFQSFAAMIAFVPTMLATLFGFFPSWVLGVFGISFGFLGILLVYKLIRG